MILRSLGLEQFRNWSALSLDFEPGLTLIVGPNGTGKTNLLEAVTLASCGASLRGAETDHMIQWGQRSGQLRAVFEGQEGLLDVQVKLRPGRAREIRLDGGSPVRMRTLVGRVPLVTFVPDDLDFVKGEPETRRRGLNMVLCQVDRSYMESLKSYQDALRQRNAVLRSMVREGRDEDPSLAVWEESMIHHGLALIKARAQLISRLKSEVQTFYEGLSQERGCVEIHYRPSIQCAGENGEAVGFWQEKFRSLRRQDLALGATTLGPHRDDLEVFLNGHPARSFASQGEQRTIALAFKFSQARYLEEETGKSPLLLLDDVLSELDELRRQRLEEFVVRGGPFDTSTKLSAGSAGERQCLVTLTVLEAWKGQALSPRVVHLSNRATDLTAV